jgi:hypothetical protein
MSVTNGGKTRALTRPHRAFGKVRHVKQSMHVAKCRGQLQRHQAHRLRKSVGIKTAQAQTCRCACVQV